MGTAAVSRMSRLPTDALDAFQKIIFATFDRHGRFARRNFGHTAALRHDVEMNLAPDAATEVVDRISIALAVYVADLPTLKGNGRPIRFNLPISKAANEHQKERG